MQHTHLSSDVKRSTLREIGDPSIRSYPASHQSPGLTRRLYNDLGSKNFLTSAFHFLSSLKKKKKNLDYWLLLIT